MNPLAQPDRDTFRLIIVRRHGSEILEDLIQNNGLMVVGAEYSLETGEVDFFDGVEEGNP